MLYLRFTLAAPLQSWGEAAPWNYKETSMIPTRSGIVGLISSCFGYRRDNPRIQELSDSIGIAVRADDPGHLVMDYQCVQSNRDFLVNAEGKKRTPKENTNLIIKKYYLQEARFTVFLQGDKNTLQSIYDAMMSPRFLTFLGRKICVPSEPVTPEWVEAENIFGAVRMFTDRDRENIRRKQVLVEMDTKGESAAPYQRKYTRRDRMINGCDRHYTLRNVTSYYVEV